MCSNRQEDDVCCRCTSVLPRAATLHSTSSSSLLWFSTVSPLIGRSSSCNGSLLIVGGRGDDSQLRSWIRSGPVLKRSRSSLDIRPVNALPLSTALNIVKGTHHCIWGSVHDFVIFFASGSACWICSFRKSETVACKFHKTCVHVLLSHLPAWTKETRAPKVWFLGTRTSQDQP